jgi:hypothetical protein
MRGPMMGRRRMMDNESDEEVPIQLRKKQVAGSKEILLPIPKMDATMRYLLSLKNITEHFGKIFGSIMLRLVVKDEFMKLYSIVYKGLSKVIIWPENLDWKKSLTFDYSDSDSEDDDVSEDIEEISLSELMANMNNLVLDTFQALEYVECRGEILEWTPKAFHEFADNTAFNLGKAKSKEIKTPESPRNFINLIKKSSGFTETTIFDKIESVVELATLFHYYVIGINHSAEFTMNIIVTKPDFEILFMELQSGGYVEVKPMRGGHLIWNRKLEPATSEPATGGGKLRSPTSNDSDSSSEKIPKIGPIGGSRMAFRLKTKP